MIKVNLIFIIILSFVLPNNILGQDKTTAKAIIEHINAYYANESSMRTTVQYLLYKDHTSNEIIEQDSAILIRKDGASLFKMGEIETLSDGQLDIMVHHTDKVIVLSKYSKKYANPLMQFSLDSLLLLCNNFETATYGNISCLFLGFAGSEATGLSICYNPSDFSLFALTIYYRYERKIKEEEGNAQMVKPRLEMRYTGVSKNAATDSRKMKSSWFVRPNGRAFKATERYKNYQVINQIIE